MNEKENIFSKIENLLEELGLKAVFFERKWLDEPEKNYVIGDLYCRPDYFSSCFVIEYANGRFEAENNLYEDGDRFPLKTGEAAILEGIRNELLKAISDVGNSQVLVMPDLQVAV